MRFAATCLFITVMVIGCRGSGGPERVVVTGRVTYQGQPLANGEIRFVPIKGTQGPVSGGRIIDGQYTVEAKGGVAVGTHGIEIVAHRPDPRFRELTESLPPDATELERPPSEQYIPEKYNTQTELEITVEPGSGKIIRDFSLTEL